MSKDTGIDNTTETTTIKTDTTTPVTTPDVVTTLPTDTTNKDTVALAGDKADVDPLTDAPVA